MDEINNQGKKLQCNHIKLKSIYGFRITFMFMNCCVPDFFFTRVPPTWLLSIVTHMCQFFPGSGKLICSLFYCWNCCGMLIFALSVFTNMIELIMGWNVKAVNYLFKNVNWLLLNILKICLGFREVHKEQNLHINYFWFTCPSHLLILMPNTLGDSGQILSSFLRVHFWRSPKKDTTHNESSTKSKLFLYSTFTIKCLWRPFFILWQKHTEWQRAFVWKTHHNLTWTWYEKKN